MDVAQPAPKRVPTSPLAAHLSSEVYTSVLKRYSELDWAQVSTPLLAVIIEMSFAVTCGRRKSP